MPPLKEYHFECKTATLTLIAIKAYDLESAMFTLIDIVKTPSDWGLVDAKL